MDFDSLYAQYSRLVFWAAYNVTKNRDAAFDVSQEVFLRALKHQKKLDAMNDMQLKGWLYRVAVNGSVDMLRRGKKELLYDVPPNDGPTDSECDMPESSAIRSERDYVLRDSVNALDDIYREPVLLHYYSGLNYHDIAALLNVAEGTVKSRMSRAKAMLRTMLGERGMNDE